MCGLKATAAVYVTYDNQYHEPLEALNFGVKVGERVVSRPGVLDLTAHQGIFS